MGTLHRYSGTQNLWNANEIAFEEEQNNDDDDNSSTMGRNPGRGQRVSDTSDLGSESRMPAGFHHDIGNHDPMMSGYQDVGNRGVPGGYSGLRDRVPSNADSTSNASQSSMFRNANNRQPVTSQQQPSRRTYVEYSQNPSDRSSSSSNFGGLNRNSEITGSQYSVRDREQSFLAKHYTSGFMQPQNNAGLYASEFARDPFTTLKRPQEVPEPRKKRLVEQRPQPPQRRVSPSPSSLLRDKQHFQDIFSVTIQKTKSSSFGFDVVGGLDNPKPSNGDPSIVVSDVVPRGPADGKLRPRDVILRVNDYSMRDIMKSEYLRYLDYVTDEAVFEVGRPNPSTMTLDTRNVTAGTVNNSSNPSSIRRITLSKLHQDEDFGIRVGVKYFIRFIPKNSAASRGNELRANDVLLKVNDINVSDVPTLKDVRTLINNTPKDELVLVVESPGMSQSTSGEVAINPLDVSGLAAGVPSPTLTSAPNSLTSQTDSGMASMTTDERDALHLHSSGAPSRPPLPSTGSSSSNTPSTLKLQSQHSNGLQPSPLNLSLNYSAMSNPGQGGQGVQQTSGGPVDIGQLKASSIDDGGFSLFNATKAAQARLTGETRVVQFDGARPLGLKLAGGNATGVFVMAVQDGSQSKRQGLSGGDEIVEVGEEKTSGMTREQVLKALQASKTHFDILIRRNQEGFRQFNSRNTSGDSFYVRAHLQYNANKEGALTFNMGDILHVTDTLPGGKDREGCYLASRVNDARKDMEAGLIPNHARAAEMRVKQEESGLRGRSHSRGSSLASRSSKRFRSLSRGRAESEISTRLKTGASQSARSSQTLPRNSKTSVSSPPGFETLDRSRNPSFVMKRKPSLLKRFAAAARGSSASKATYRLAKLSDGPSTAAMPVYERVRLKHASFARPIVIFGPIADLARDQLINDSSHKYLLPEPDDFAPNVINGSTVNIRSIRKVMDQNCHCVLDISPGCVQWLNMVGLYPIVIFFKPDSNKHVKAVRSSFKSQKGVGGGGQKVYKELYQVATEIERHYSHLISDKIHLSANNVWYAKLTDTIKKHQAAQIWQSETPNVDPAAVADVSLSVGQWAKEGTGTLKRGALGNTSLNNTMDGTSAGTFGRRDSSTSNRRPSHQQNPGSNPNGLNGSQSSTLTASHRNKSGMQERSRSASGILEDRVGGGEGVYESFDTPPGPTFDRQDAVNTSIAGSQDSRMRSNGNRTPTSMMHQQQAPFGSSVIKSQTYDADLSRQALERESFITPQSRSSSRPQTLMSMPPLNDVDGEQRALTSPGFSQQHQQQGEDDVSPLGGPDVRGSMQSRHSSQYDMLRASQINMESGNRYPFQHQHLQSNASSTSNNSHTRQQQQQQQQQKATTMHYPRPHPHQDHSNQHSQPMRHSHMNLNNIDDVISTRSTPMQINYKTNTSNPMPQWQRPTSQPNNVQTLLREPRPDMNSSNNDYSNIRPNPSRTFSGEDFSRLPDDSDLLPPPHPPLPNSQALLSAQHQISGGQFSSHGSHAGGSRNGSSASSWQRGGYDNNFTTASRGNFNDQQSFSSDNRVPLKHSQFSRSQPNIQKPTTPSNSNPSSQFTGGPNYFTQLRTNTNAQPMNL
ncbi:uncharacterized protein LOC142349449 isoform X4 [Convolutriloba macropyga]|uniref:uncharacterized protein LOC142349449 isoform X4 n=1 Tax=Convolutriloba macropyga TaxID=536237 RepID=UPI003F51B019